MRGKWNKFSFSFIYLALFCHIVKNHHTADNLSLTIFESLSDENKGDKFQVLLSLLFMEWVILHQEQKERRQEN